MTLAQDALTTHSVQWMERTLDDSANRRLCIPESFLATDTLLFTLQNVSEGLVVNEGLIARNVRLELPFLSTENLLMALVKHGGSRQEGHEEIRKLSLTVAANMKENGGENDLLPRMKASPVFAPIRDKIDDLLDSRAYVGRAPDQVTVFLEEEVKPALKPYANWLDGIAELNI